MATHSPDAERSVLCALLTDMHCLDTVRDVLPSPEAFYGPSHRRVYEAVCDLSSRGIAVDITTVAIWLRDREWLNSTGDETHFGVAWLSRLLDATPYVENVESYAHIIRDKWRVRRIVAAAQHIQMRAERDYGSADQLLEEAEKYIAQVSQDAGSDGSVQMFDLVKGEVEKICAINNGEPVPKGLPYGYVALDELTTGMYPGEVTVLAARPGMGKSALAVCVSVAAAKYRADGVTNGVYFQSLEMKQTALVKRALSVESNVQARKLYRREQTGDEWDRFMASAHSVAQLPIWVDEGTQVTPSQLRAKVRRLKREFERVKGQRLSLVVVDYLQRMGADTHRKDRFTEVAENMNAVSNMAKELDVHVLLLAQVNRENTKREGAAKRPRMSDLAESGEIEKAANTIIFIHRPEYYVQDKANVPEHWRGMSELIVDKQREGETGLVMVRYEGAVTSFKDPTEAEVRKWTSAPPERERGKGKGRWAA
jgi:replicative DNA helicase